MFFTRPSRWWTNTALGGCSLAMAVVCSIVSSRRSNHPNSSRPRRHDQEPSSCSTTRKKYVLTHPTVDRGQPKREGPEVPSSAPFARDVLDCGEPSTSIAELLDASFATTRFDEVQQLDGVPVVLEAVHRLLASVAQHFGASLHHQLMVALAPFGERAHRFNRPFRVSADSSAILSEGRNDTSLSSHFQRSHGLRTIPAGRGRHRHLSPPFSRDCSKVSRTDHRKTAGQRIGLATVLVAGDSEPAFPSKFFDPGRVDDGSASSSSIRVLFNRRTGHVTDGHGCVTTSRRFTARRVAALWPL